MLKLARSNYTSAEEISSNKNNAMIVNHSYSGAENWSISTMGNMDDTYYDVTNIAKDESNAGVSVENSMGMVFSIKQMVSFLSWRSEDMPINFSASSRISQNRSTTSMKALLGGFVRSESLEQSINLAIGGSYELSQASHLGGNLRVNRVASSFDDKTDNIQELAQDASMDLRADYSPEGTSWGPFDHNWFVNGSMDHHVARGQAPRTHLKELLGQSLGKEIYFGEEIKLDLSLSQSNNASQRQGASPTWGTNHSFSGKVSRPHQTGQTSLDLSLTDTRAFGAEESDAQLANLQLSSDGNMWDIITWKGHVTTQWGRESAEDKVEISHSSMAGVDLSFQRNNLFGVRRLSFDSKLSINVTDSLLPLGMYIGYEGASEQRSWWNTFGYRAGKISARLTVGGTETDSDDGGLSRNGLILFEVRRFFATAF